MDEAEQTVPGDDGVVLSECPSCGTTLESAAVGHLLPSDTERADHAAGGVVFTDFCPNSDCPGKENDMSTSADGR